MAIIKCKMCGGDLQVIEGSTVCECEYCGTKQTVPTLDNEKKLTLFNRASRLLRNCEFDKASVVFETIVAEFPEEAEAYWGLVLCKYGIEYVDDPATGKKIPTCHRSSFDSVEDDTNFEQACENADAVARRLYREEARQIETLRKRIIEVSGKEEPYDIFISYKELDENGERTIDSVIAQDIYKALTNEGYRVFFSRVSLEGKLGVEYEPYIFAALNSARVMIVVGTDYDYFDAVWVKNEWSRFLHLINSGQQRTIIPAYKGMDPYDMPKELRNLAAQDMGKIGAMQDLLHGVEKLIGKQERILNDNQNEKIIVKEASGPNITAFLKRGSIALQDGEWDKSKVFFDQALNIDAECAEAYLGLLMADAKAHTLEDYQNLYTNNATIRSNKNIQRIYEFGDGKLKSWFAALSQSAIDEDEKKRILKERQDAEQRAAEILTRRQNELRLKPLRDRNAIAKDLVAVHGNHILAIMPDGSVQVAEIGRGFPLDVSYWSDIKSVSSGVYGVKDDGRVVTSENVSQGGKNYHGAFDVSKWNNIKKVICLYHRAIGVTNDGRVVATKFIKDIDDSDSTYSVLHDSFSEYDYSGWTDIIDISGKQDLAVGLKSDGTLITTKQTRNLSSWSNIVAIDVQESHITGLRGDGTVVISGDFPEIEKVMQWSDIIDIAGAYEFLAGLKSNGTVLTAGRPWSYEQANVLKKWNHIVAIKHESNVFVGINEYGVVICVNSNGYESKPFDTRIFSEVSSIPQEHKIARKKAKESRRIRAEELTEEKKRLHREYQELKGIFTSRRKKEIETRIIEIDEKLRKLGV